MRKQKLKCRDCGETLKENQQLAAVVIYKPNTPLCDIHICCGAECLKQHVMKMLVENGALEQHGLKYKTYERIYLPNLLLNISGDFWRLVHGYEAQ